jgi:hypothetical protein
MMTTEKLRESCRQVNRAGLPDREIRSVYCGDLLSHVMGESPEGAAWVTVMSNVIVIAVASLTDAACVIVASGALPDDEVIARADEHDVPLFTSADPVFETALRIHESL